MEKIHLGDQIIGYDRERTRAAYATMKKGAAEKCGCPYCQNFVAQRGTVYPENFRQLLDQLGVDSEKEGEVYEGAPQGSIMSYAGWFYLAGEVIEPGERLTDAGPGFRYFFRRSHKPPALREFGEEVLALEFSTSLPWVISDRPEWL